MISNLNITQISLIIVFAGLLAIILYLLLRKKEISNVSVIAVGLGENNNNIIYKEDGINWIVSKTTAY